MRQPGKGMGMRRSRTHRRRLVIAELDDRRVLGRPGGSVVFQVREAGKWTDRGLWPASLVRDEIITAFLEGRRDV
jgi:hypothetical protein